MRIIMAGGGTGGHLFAILALADEFKARDKSAQITFIGVRGKIEEDVLIPRGYSLELLNVEAIQNKRGLGRIRALLKAATAIAGAIRILRRIRPDAVIGSGSYVSGPVIVAARILGIKTALLEQNVLPGTTNRYLARFVDRAYISFKASERFFPVKASRLSGTPIRREVIEGKAVDKKKVKGRIEDKFNILVFGGSLGAEAINTAFIDATDHLSDIWMDLKVIHQCGRDGLKRARESYASKGLKVETHGFIEDMGSAYAEADLVICRAGATTLAEVTALGLPSIMIPYPFATFNHQEVNARYLADKGACVLITQKELTAKGLAGAIRGFYADRGLLNTMALKAGSLGNVCATGFIADDFSALLGGH